MFKSGFVFLYLFLLGSIIIIVNCNKLRESAESDAVRNWGKSMIVGNNSRFASLWETTRMQTDWCHNREMYINVQRILSYWEQLDLPYLWNITIWLGQIDRINRGEQLYSQPFILLEYLTSNVSHSQTLLQLDNDDNDAETLRERTFNRK